MESVFSLVNEGSTPQGVQIQPTVGARHGPSSTKGSRAGTLEPSTPFRGNASFGNTGVEDDAMRDQIRDGPPADIEDEEGDDGQGLGLGDDEYTAQEATQYRSKANLRVLMDNFSEDQQQRYDWYRRSAFNRNSVRRLIQQGAGQNVSLPVAQAVGGVAKIFVGEIVEKAIQVQEERGETGPLSPEHLREAYNRYKEAKGNVGPARPLRGKRLAL